MDYSHYLCVCVSTACEFLVLLRNKHVLCASCMCCSLSLHTTAAQEESWAAEVTVCDWVCFSVRTNMSFRTWQWHFVQSSNLQMTVCGFRVQVRIRFRFKPLNWSVSSCFVNHYLLLPLIITLLWESRAAEASVFISLLGGVVLLPASVPTVLGVVASQSRGIAVTNCCRCLFHHRELCNLQAGFCPGLSRSLEVNWLIWWRHSVLNKSN